MAKLFIPHPAHIAMPAIRTAAFTEPRPLTAAGGLVQSGGYFRQLHRRASSTYARPIKAAIALKKPLMP